MQGTHWYATVRWSGTRGGGREIGKRLTPTISRSTISFNFKKSPFLMNLSPLKTQLNSLKEIKCLSPEDNSEHIMKVCQNLIKRKWPNAKYQGCWHWGVFLRDCNRVDKHNQRELEGRKKSKNSPISPPPPPQQAAFGICPPPLNAVQLVIEKKKRRMGRKSFKSDQKLKATAAMNSVAINH